MSNQVPSVDPRLSWRDELPVLVGTSVTLREPVGSDVPELLEVLLTAESVRFGIDDPLNAAAAARFVDQARLDRAQGRSVTYVATLTQSGRIVGLFQARALDPMFENAECEAALLPPVRGTGLLDECAQLFSAFTFGTLAVHRLELRVLLENGRATGALRKLGAMQEGVLRRAVQRNGRYYDQVLWSLLRSDWQGRREVPGGRVH